MADLLAICNQIRREMSGDWAGEGGPAGSEALLERIRKSVWRVENTLRRHPEVAAAMAGPSRRAYQWLRFLAVRSNLEAHRTTLALARQAVSKLDPGTGRPGSASQAGFFPVFFDFYHIEALYRYRRTHEGGVVTAAQAFVGAPAEIIEALVKAALGSGRGRSEPLGIVRDYAAGPGFRRVMMELEAGAGLPEPETRGRAVDLEEVFRRVNREHFGGRLERPTLTWSRVPTRRKLGHYHPATDTVMLSRTLDDPRVPPLVVDFVMYHELLHKDLGVNRSNRRTTAHSVAFRREERRFPGYAEAQEWCRRAL